MTATDDAPLGDRQWSYPNLTGRGYVYSRDAEVALYVLGGIRLTPDQARGLADTLRQAADELDGDPAHRPQ
jgi:hypothetical protein